MRDEALCFFVRWLSKSASCQPQQPPITTRSGRLLGLARSRDSARSVKHATRPPLRLVLVASERTSSSQLRSRRRRLRGGFARGAFGGWLLLADAVDVEALEESGGGDSSTKRGLESECYAIRDSLRVMMLREHAHPQEERDSASTDLIQTTTTTRKGTFPRMSLFLYRARDTV